MTSKPFVIPLLLLAVAGQAAATPPDQPPFSVQTVDLWRIDCRGVAIDAEGVHIRTADSQRTMPRGEVAEVTLAAADACDEQMGVGLVETVWGDRLPTTEMSVTDGKVSFRSPVTGEVQTDLSGVAALYIPRKLLAPAQVHRRAEPMLPEKRTTDLLVVARGGEDWTVIDGVLQEMDEQDLTFRFRDADRRVKLSSVSAVMLASAETPEHPAGRLVAKDGSVLAFRKISLDSESAMVDTLAFGPMEVPRKDIAAVRFESDHVVPLSALEPAEETHHGLFGEGFEPRRNRSAGGSPLRLDGRQYADGLGLHSFCEVTYDLDGEYRRFAAVVGIDDAVRPLGDATLTILADDKAVVDGMRITGTDRAESIRRDVSGARKLTIRVEFGDDSLDVSDHVNLAAARLIR